MLRLNNQLNNLKLISIHASQIIGTINEPLINPHKLTIVGFYCNIARTPGEMILLVDDIREYSPKGIIINHEEEITPPEDLHRLQEIIDISFKLIGKKVVTESKKKLGSATEYTFDDQTFAITKLHVSRPAWRSFSEATLIIGRRQIVSVDDKKITVKDGVVKEKAAAPVPAADLEPAA